MAVSLADALTDPGRIARIVMTAGISDVDADTLFEAARQTYPDRKIEMDGKGNIIVSPLSSEDSSYRSGETFAQLRNWAVKDGTGRAFDATSIFNLPNGAKRQPDAAWVSRRVLRQEGPEALRTVTKTRHVPEFLIEVTSPSDLLEEQQGKCREWIDAGVQECFLVHPAAKTVWIYRPHESTFEISEAKQVESTALRGFILSCQPIWEELG